MDTIKTHSGFITLEVILSLFILTVALSGIILVTFGNQYLLSDTRTNREALGEAQKILEEASAIGHADFALLNPIPTRTLGIYRTELDVESVDFFTKKVTVKVSWTNETLLSQTIQLTQIIADNENVVGGDTCDSYTTLNWTSPEIKNSPTDFGNSIGDTTTMYSISDIDAYENKLYVTIENTSVNTKETFFIFDISDPENPELIGKTDNSPTTMSGIRALAVASSSLGSYAYVANGVHSNFNSCTRGKNCAQLQVIDVLNPTNPTIASNFLIPTSTPPFVTGSGGRAVGQSIFYKNGYVYIGLTKTTTGPEFNIIDVHDPLHPIWTGGLSLGTSIHSIQVRGDYAYVTHKADNTGPQEQLTVINIRDPHNPYRVSGFFYSGGILNAGKSTSIVGDTLYLGRLASKITGSNDSIPELYALNISDPTAVYPIVVSSISLETPESLNGVIVRDTLAFFVTTSKFQVWSIPRTSSSTPIASLLLPTGGSVTPSIDCEGNYFFISSNNASNRGFISIIGN